MVVLAEAHMTLMIVLEIIAWLQPIAHLMWKARAGVEVDQMDVLGANLKEDARGS